MQSKEYILVVDENDKVLGFVTSYDIASLYLNLMMPYTNIQSIEYAIRQVLYPIDIDELKKACVTEGRKRNISSINDMEFSDYITVFSRLWDKIGLSCDRDIFLNLLNQVREARNKIMHFNTNSLTDKEKDLIKTFVNLLKK